MKILMLILSINLDHAYNTVLLYDEDEDIDVDTFH
jgi:hypothetical protein